MQKKQNIRCYPDGREFYTKNCFENRGKKTCLVALLTEETDFGDSDVVD